MSEAIRPQPGTPSDPTEPVQLLLRDLRATRAGLSGAEVDRRLVVYGRNELVRRGGRRWPRELARQFTHPLALLLWAAAALALGSGSDVLAAAIVGVIVLNAALAFVQELQAERAVEALKRYLPPQATVLRDGAPQVVDAATLVPGDVLLIQEGDGISADARLLRGSLEVDMSTLTGESLPVVRDAEAVSPARSPLEARDLVFSGTVCTAGQAEALVFATGMRTEVGRISALSERAARDESPLERQVRRVAWIIALVAVGVGLAFVPLGVFVGLSLGDAVRFAIGLLVANVPEGLLPTITLSLALGVRILSRRGALVKRLSAVETLGSTAVICTDKTGTLTENRMQVVALWTTAGELALDDGGRTLDDAGAGLVSTIAACNMAAASADGRGGDPTDVALLEAAQRLGVGMDRAVMEARRRARFNFDPAVRMMTTIDEEDGVRWVHVKGAPEEVLERSRRLAAATGEASLTSAERERIARQLDAYASRGLRVLGVARRRLQGGEAPPERREDAERDLTFLGLAAMFDPPRAEVADAVQRCHTAGIRIIVVTGDHGRTAAEVARRLGIGGPAAPVVTGDELDRMSDSELDHLLARGEEIIFARSSPEAKLRIADALRAQGHVVAMTGDGVNDAPALRRADIGVAMGESGTDVAREAATMILTDDNFDTIVRAVEEGRRVYDNVRKFILYIFAHATPEIVPFLVFALSGGLIPLPLTALQILAIDLGTETLPAIALGREAAEPGTMTRPPRPRRESIIGRSLLVRAWGLLGLVSAALVMGGFFAVLLHSGWRPGDDVGAGSPLHHAYLQATTMTFLGIVACQIGTAFAARTERVSLRTVGILTNPLLLVGIGFELAFAAALTYVEPLQSAFGTAAVSAAMLALLVPFPFLVWGADEVRRAIRRRGRLTPLGAGEAGASVVASRLRKPWERASSTDKERVR